MRPDERPAVKSSTTRGGREYHECIGDESGPEIKYVPGGGNHYDYENDVIVLDERLKDYPRAHEIIRQHELEHVDKTSVWEYFVHEFQADIRTTFDDSEDMREVREYLGDHESKRKLGYLRAIGFNIVQIARGFWKLAMIPAGMAYRRLGGGDPRLGVVLASVMSIAGVFAIAVSNSVGVRIAGAFIWVAAVVAAYGAWYDKRGWVGETA